MGQIHLGGHVNVNGLLIDTHDQAIAPEVWSLFQWYGENFGHPTAMVERDAAIPEWSVLEAEVLKLRSLFLPEPTRVQETGLEVGPELNTELNSERHSHKNERLPRKNFSAADLELLEQQWARSLLHDFEVEGILDQLAPSAKERFQIYEHAFWSRLERVVQDDFKHFKKKVEEWGEPDAWSHLFYTIVTRKPPSSYSITEYGEDFIMALRELGHAHLSDAEEDWAREKAWLSAKAELPLMVKTDFKLLAELKVEELERVQLVLQPSMHTVPGERMVFWYHGAEIVGGDSGRTKFSDEKTSRVKVSKTDAGNAKKQVMNQEEWIALMAVQAGAKLTELGTSQDFLPHWVANGLVCGWQIIDRKKEQT